MSLINDLIAEPINNKEIELIESHLNSILFDLWPENLLNSAFGVFKRYVMSLLSSISVRNVRLYCTVLYPHIQ